MACYDVSLNEKYEGPKLEYRLLPTFGPSIFIRQLWCSLMRGTYNYVHMKPLRGQFMKQNE